jgi:phosphoketolase
LRITAGFLAGAFVKGSPASTSPSSNQKTRLRDTGVAGNRWQDVLEVTNRAWSAETLPWDDHLAPDGRVMEMLSEHQCQGWLEGYLPTGRHGFFSCYEAFIHIIDSMLNQHAKWLKGCGHIPWRRPIASLNYLLSSHVWRQDHNGFSHQDPGFIDHVANKKAGVVRKWAPVGIPSIRPQASIVASLGLVARLTTIPSSSDHFLDCCRGSCQRTSW